jgi:hypothetical protein
MLSAKHRLPGFFFCVFLACLPLTLWTLGVGWNHNLMDEYGFRQAQTAISSFYMLHGGSWWTYETPVLGAPWAIPFEFPVYQWIVAGLVKLSGMSLNPAGRLVSSFFYLLSILPFYSILRSLGVKRDQCFVFLTLLMVSPIYVFWSRTFMIESTAFFFSMAYLAFVARYLQRISPWTSFACAALFGAVGALVKITTFYGFAWAAGFLLLMRLWKEFRKADRASKFHLIKVVFPVIVLIALPVGCALLWTHHADEEKLLNPEAANFITSTALQTWNFGTLDQRLSSDFWLKTLVLRGANDVIGHRITLLASFILIAFARKYIVHYLVCIFLFIVVPLTFTNIHIIHSYYPYANGVFLIAALGWSVIALGETGLLGFYLSRAVLLFAILGCCLEYQRSLLPVQRANVNPYPGIAAAIRKGTQVNDVIIIFGLDWSAELPYLAERRALMLRTNPELDSNEVKLAVEDISQDHRRIGGLVACGAQEKDAIHYSPWLTRFNLAQSPNYDDATCSGYFRLN